MQQSEADKIKSDVLTAVMQVLKPLTLVLAAEAKADRARMASALALMGSHPSLDPAAREILEQLAEGLAVIGGAGKTRN
jgi:hypothetical protein